MQVYKGLNALLDAVLGKEINEWVYSNVKSLFWKPLNATFYIIPEEEINNMSEDEIYVDEDGCEMPKEYKHLKLSEWLEVADIEDIIEYLSNQKEDADIRLKAKALQYYYKNDAFMEL